MTDNVDIVNRALQAIGSRTSVTSAELLANSSNEAINANLILETIRDDLLRMAPWNCATSFANLTYITSTPGTPENTSAAPTTWAKGMPPPGWAYEYQYPVDCLRPLFIVPQTVAGFASGFPITTAITGSVSRFWQGPPIKYKVGIDQFFPVTAAAVQAGGSGYAVGDIITLESGPITSAPIGAPVQLVVLTAPAGVAATVSVVNQVLGSSTAQGGSYFARQTNPVAQGSTTGSGTGATFNLTYGAQASQRVILTNQEFATLAYIKQVTDPNVMDPLFQDAWVTILGARLVMALVGDKSLANLKVGEANNYVLEARKADGNEGLTINDVTPDWIRARGYADADFGWTPNQSFEWGNYFSLY